MILFINDIQFICENILKFKVIAIFLEIFPLPLHPLRMPAPYQRCFLIIRYYFTMGFKNFIFEWTYFCILILLNYILIYIFVFFIFFVSFIFFIFFYFFVFFFFFIFIVFFIFFVFFIFIVFFIFFVFSIFFIFFISQNYLCIKG